MDNGKDPDGDDYREENLYVSFDKSDTLKDVIDHVVQANRVDLGDYFNIYVDGECKNDIYEKLGDVFDGVYFDEVYVMEFSKIIDETSSSESEVEDEVVNQVIFEDLAFPFEKISLPLRKSSFTRLGTVVLSDIEDFLDDLKAMDVLGEPLRPKDFQLEADGVILDGYESLADQVSHPEL